MFQHDHTNNDPDPMVKYLAIGSFVTNPKLFIHQSSYDISTGLEQDRAPNKIVLPAYYPYNCLIYNVSNRLLNNRHNRHDIIQTNLMMITDKQVVSLGTNKGRR